tara:strand:+ start:2481 stop:2672 length:192 start_codon:yes stop_codon:yes gene_type:complete
VLVGKKHRQHSGLSAGASSEALSFLNKDASAGLFQVMPLKRSVSLSENGVKPAKKTKLPSFTA